MGFFKSLAKLETKPIASIGVDQEIIDLQAQRIRLLFEALQKQGFTEDQALQIVCWMTERGGGFRA